MHLFIERIHLRVYLFSVMKDGIKFLRKFSKFCPIFNMLDVYLQIDKNKYTEISILYIFF